MLRTKHHTGTLPFKPIDVRLQDGNGQIYKIVDELYVSNYNLGNSNADSLLVVERESDGKQQKISSIFLDNFLNDEKCSIIGDV